MPKFRPPKFLSPPALWKILHRYECTFNTKHGKGSHCKVMRKLPDGVHPFSLPEKRTYGRDYINNLRRALHLTPEDGVSDRDFYPKQKGRK